MKAAHCKGKGYTGFITQKHYCEMDWLKNKNCPALIHTIKEEREMKFLWFKLHMYHERCVTEELVLVPDFHHQKEWTFCSRSSFCCFVATVYFGFGKTWGWVHDDGIVILGETISIQLAEKSLSGWSRSSTNYPIKAFEWCFCVKSAVRVPSRWQPGGCNYPSIQSRA